MIFRKTDMCEALRRAIDDPSVALFYGPAERACGILQLELDELPVKRFEGDLRYGMTPPSFGIEYCPWSGEPLPPDLGPMWEKAVQVEFGEEFLPWMNGPAGLPDAFKSEDWWVNRNIHHPDGFYDTAIKNHWPNRAIIQPNIVPWDEPWEPFSDPTKPGLSRWPQKPVHHCWEAEMIWWGPRFMYAYIPYTREFGVRIIDVHQPVDRQPIRIEPVRYCPFCGDLLPASLRDEWRTRTTAAGFDPDDPPGPIPETWPKGFPVDLASDNWWREEGL